MNKTSPIIVLFLTICLVGTLTSCGPSNPDNTVEPSTSDTQKNESKTKKTSTDGADSTGSTSSTSARPKLVYYQMPG